MQSTVSQFLLPRGIAQRSRSVFEPRASAVPREDISVAVTSIISRDGLTKIYCMFEMLKHNTKLNKRPIKKEHYKNVISMFEYAWLVLSWFLF
jgi:hypothetical protein